MRRSVPLFSIGIWFAIAWLAQAQEPSAGLTVSVRQMRVSPKDQEQLQTVRVQLVHGEFAKARQEAGRILSKTPDFADALSVRARIALRENRIAEALADAHRSLELDPQLPNAHFALGEILNREGRFEEALPSLDRCIALAPTAWTCRYERARALLGTTRLMPALNEIQEAANLGGLKNEPQAIYYLRGSLFLLLHDYASGTRDLEAVLRVSPRGATAEQARLALETLRGPERK